MRAKVAPVAKRARGHEWNVVRWTTDAETRLRGRRAEREALDRLIANARAGTSGVLVLRGEAGVGKTALLDYLVAHASGSRVVRAAGVESEMELAFAALHQLCMPFLDRLDRLPGPQRDALRTAFGLRDGGAPDRFLVGLAVLTLLSDVAESRPLVCLLDDAQWLDQASAQVLGFVARRLTAEAVITVFAVREPSATMDLAGLPELKVGPLHDSAARDLLATAIPGRLDESVRDRILTEAGGNPLALLELPRAWTPAMVAGGFGLPDGVSVSGRIEESFRRRLMPLPEHSRRLLVVAAAEPVGDPVRIWGAAERLGISMDAAGPATTAGLLDIGTRFRFRHPLVRSVVYAEATSVRAPVGPFGSGRCDRPNGGPRSPGVASCRGGARSRRGRRPRTRAFRRAGSGSRRSRCRGCIPPASVRADPRPRSGDGSGARRRASKSPCGRVRCSPWTPGRSTCRTARRGAASSCGPTAGTHRLRLKCRKRRTAAAAQGGPTTRVDRR